MPNKTGPVFLEGVDVVVKGAEDPCAEDLDPEPEPVDFCPDPGPDPDPWPVLFFDFFPLLFWP